MSYSDMGASSGWWSLKEEASPVTVCSTHLFLTFSSYLKADGSGDDPWTGVELVGLQGDVSLPSLGPNEVSFIDEDGHSSASSFSLTFWNLQVELVFIGHFLYLLTNLRIWNFFWICIMHNNLVWEFCGGRLKLVVESGVSSYAYNVILNVSKFVRQPILFVDWVHIRTIALAFTSNAIVRITNIRVWSYHCMKFKHQLNLFIRQINYIIHTFSSINKK